jgi:hypothetical protein
MSALGQKRTLADHSITASASRARAAFFSARKVIVAHRGDPFSVYSAIASLIREMFAMSEMRPSGHCTRYMPA